MYCRLEIDLTSKFTGALIDDLRLWCKDQEFKNCLKYELR